MNRNKIIEAAEQDDATETSSEIDEFELSMADELTDEDVIDEVETLSGAERQQLERSRQRGQAPARGHTTAARQLATARDPVRERPAVNWTPSNTLDAPPPQAGMEQRWIRFLMGANNDPQNWARKVRDGWSPRKLDTIPEDYAPPKIEHGTLGGVIAVGDLILCERAREIGAARRKYFREKHQRQIEASKRYHRRVSQADHPISEYDPAERPTVGRGNRRPKVQEDE